MIIGASARLYPRAILPYGSLNFLQDGRSKYKLQVQDKEIIMSIEKLDKESWAPYFDSMSKVLAGKQAEIDVESLSLGVQVASRFAPLHGITYDRRGEMLEIMLERWEHNIPHVHEIWIDRDGVSLNSIRVVGSDGIEQIIKLRDPLMLPDPHIAAGANRQEPGAGAPR